MGGTERTLTAVAGPLLATPIATPLQGSRPKRPDLLLNLSQRDFSPSRLQCELFDLTHDVGLGLLTWMAPMPVVVLGASNAGQLSALLPQKQLESKLSRALLHHHTHILSSIVGATPPSH